jgi:DNA invertase Pin-like site-specific DNA recombinase
MTRCAIYTRYSSTHQREASCEDQARNCGRRIESERWDLTAHFKDEAISGSRSDRPGYLQMLKAASERQFDVLIVDDLSRFSRDQVENERAIRRMEFGGIRIIALSDGYDSQSKSRKIQRGVKGLMNELYLDDLRDKTHRGLSGQALKKYWAGGKPYGYRLVRDKDPKRLDTHGDPLALGTRLEVDANTDVVVTEIFRQYADGKSPRAIADELNRRGVPSPGSTWRNRKVRRLSGWLGSAVRAILSNEIYAGQYVWNRTAWQKDPDSGRRRVVKRPQSEWIRSELPELRIVPEELYCRVQARHAAATRAGINVREGIKRAGHRAGRNPAYLFSSLLKCGACNANMTIVGGTGKWKAYGCATRKEGGAHACSNGITVQLSTVERCLLAPIKRDLLSDEVKAELRRRIAKAVAIKPAKKSSNIERIAQLRAEIANLADAVASGALRTSKTLAERLATSETELEQLSRATPARTASVTRIPEQLEERYKRIVARLETEYGRDVHRARGRLRQLVGDSIPLVPHESGKHLVARVGLDLQELLQVNGAPEIFMVAGACYANFRRRFSLDSKAA